LNAKNLASDDADEALIDYSGFAPTADEIDDGAVAVAGLLSVTQGLQGELDDANDTEGDLVSVEGSTLYRNAAEILWACKNCSASADSGTVGSDPQDLVCQCAGTFQGNESFDFAAYTASLASLEATSDADLDTKDAKALDKAAKDLLRVEYMQI
jgi:hypothetical protein